MEEINPKLPSWSGDWAAFEQYELRVSLEIDSTKKDEQCLLGPRLAKNLTGKAFELVETLDRDSLKKENGADYLITFLKEQRGKDRVDIMGDALKDLFVKQEVMRKDGEEFMEYLPRFRHYMKAVDTALKAVNPSKQMPSEFYGWYLLNVTMKLEPSDVANIKAKAESYGLTTVENAIKTMWSGGGLALRDAERKRLKTLKAYMAWDKSEGGSVYASESMDGWGDGGDPDEDADSDEQAQEQFEETLTAYLEDPENDELLIAYQDGKKKMQYREARKLLTKSRTSREYYPLQNRYNNKKKDSDKPASGQTKSEHFFDGDCIRCGKYGHKARFCPQRQKPASANYAQASDDLVGLVCPMAEKEPNMIALVDRHAIVVEKQPVFATLGNESRLMGILDSGASETIIGADTLQDLYEEFERLGFDPRQEIRVNRTMKKSFVFGNNEVGMSLGLARLNVGLVGKEVTIEAHVVEGPTPLLLSAKFLLEHRVVVDFSTGKAWFPDQMIEPVQLGRTSSYHLLLPVTGFAGNADILQKMTKLETAEDEVKVLVTTSGTRSTEGCETEPSQLEH